VTLKGLDRDSPSTFERQQRRRDAVYFAAKYLPLDQGFNIHGEGRRADLTAG
jgi:hypothetical protein